MFNQSNSYKIEKGQGLVEYALILVLVAVVVIGALMALGPIISNVFDEINNSLATVGGSGSASPASALTSEQQEMLNHVCGKYSGATFTVDASGNMSSSNSGLDGAFEDGIPAGIYSCP